MLIDTNQHDYYDTCMKHGIDKNIIFHRNRNNMISIDSKLLIERYPTRHTIFNTNQILYLRDVLNIKELMLNNRDYYRYPPIDDNPKIYPIIFCGDIYHVCIIYDKEKMKNMHIYDIDTIKKLYTDFSGTYYNNQKKYYFSFSKKEISELFYNISSTRDIKSFCIENKITVGMLDKHYNFNMYVNYDVHKKYPSYKHECEPIILKNYEFYKIKQPYVVFNELETYIGSILSKDENKIVTISDKDKLYKHGFDNKSFKKEKQ